MDTKTMTNKWDGHQFSKASEAVAAVLESGVDEYMLSAGFTRHRITYTRENSAGIIQCVAFDVKRFSDNQQCHFGAIAELRIRGKSKTSLSPSKCPMVLAKSLGHYWNVLMRSRSNDVGTTASDVLCDIRKTQHPYEHVTNYEGLICEFAGSDVGAVRGRLLALWALDRDVELEELWRTSLQRMLDVRDRKELEKCGKIIGLSVD
ncbi:MAG: hypothetical protein KDA69_06085 [Planctomycetaceae bacterium]|nr:hypothetical protein [Planctomycetaceae bacterium]